MLKNPLKLRLFCNIFLTYHTFGYTNCSHRKLYPTLSYIKEVEALHNSNEINLIFFSIDYFITQFFVINPRSLGSLLINKCNKTVTCNLMENMHSTC
jgi:hypothetical protein